MYLLATVATIPMAVHQVRQGITQDRRQAVYHPEQIRYAKQLTIAQIRLVLLVSLGTAFRLLNVKVLNSVKLTAVIRHASMAFVVGVFPLHLLRQLEHAEYVQKVVIGMVSNLNKRLV